ncbi:G-type lectin S-receptor-like serine/threonine-protein kinase CES101 isoform X2 [Solanum pennellii]|uniref:G-type lectin S-receptor-like serine/threonine-protein kinase CES101 isoform X2 n=1 Tax=Solanum pennellii TaxID=28526 RepID=A0ABM1VHK7_SOLPN|nr:G-type lectin S-receptor-like serine/threonine-protein kinase CES101 isoform X2 [Solanum pennellii]
MRLETLTLWQSFDHPTNCLLPGMKLGYNLTTMQNWTTYSSYIDEKRKEEAYIRELTAVDSFNNANLKEEDGREVQDLKIFSFGFILEAKKNNFSSEKMLGEGGFWPVYKGNFPDGREMAVKRLSRTSGQGLVEFKNELILIARVQPTNLVRVLGCCIDGDERMLIYEYMPNKSLNFFLFARMELPDWQKRFAIIEGIALSSQILKNESDT